MKSSVRSLLVPSAAAAAVVALGVGSVVLLGVHTLLAIAGAMALLGLATVAAAVAALATVARRRLAEVEHLPYLGHTFDTEHDGARITGLSAGPQGTVAVIATDSSHTVVLDDTGAPEHVRSGGPALVRCPVPSSDVPALQEYVAGGGAIRLWSTGVIGIAGPVTTGWRVRPPLTVG